MVNNVIGPINRRNWKTLRMLRYSIKQMKAANDPDLFSQIEKESALYAELLELCVKPQEAMAEAA